MSEKKPDTEGKNPEETDLLKQQQEPPKAEPKPEPKAEPAKQVAVTDGFLAPEDLAEAAESVRKSLPEQLAALAPSEPAELFKWYAKALETGAVKIPSAPVPPTDTTRPKSTVPEEDLSKLPPIARMSRGYGAAN